MKNFFEKLRVEDWVVVWVSIPLLLLAALIPADLPSVPATLVGEVAWYNIGLLFAIVLVVLVIAVLLWFRLYGRTRRYGRASSKRYRQHTYHGRRR